MKILTATEMGAADRASVEAGVSVRELMHNAGSAVARFCLKHSAEDGFVVVLCGKGNNGGDGMVAAAELADYGRNVRIALLGKAAEVKGDAADALRLASKQEGVEFIEVADEAALHAALEGATLILDAIVGTGFKPPLRGLAATARDLVAAMKTPVVAVDLPSGWNADSTEMRNGEAFRADAVVTFAAPKLAHVFGHLTPADTFGPVVVAPIGTPEEAIQSSANLFWAGSAKALAEQPRAVDGNKGRFGHALILGGSFGKTGAPAMACMAALRAGAGLVTAAVPREVVPMVAAAAPELMSLGLAQSGQGGLALETLEAEPLAALLKGISVVGIGPGLGQEGSTPDFVRGFVERVTVPMVLDADALNAIAGRSEWLKEVAAKPDAKGNRRTIVMTPHPGEMGRLVNMTVKEVEADRIGLARRFATEYGITLVLKGWRTLIAHPDGRIAVNTTGNPAMAKGGSGDVLTGIVSAMLAQYKDDVAQAVEAAVFLHGLAGDFATMAQDEHTVLATDTVAHLWEAFRSRIVDDDGFTWITAMAANGVPPR